MGILCGVPKCKVWCSGIQKDTEVICNKNTNEINIYKNSENSLGVFDSFCYLSDLISKREECSESIVFIVRTGEGKRREIRKGLTAGNKGINLLNERLVVYNACIGIV